jgi:hypothetical protein
MSVKDKQMERVAAMGVVLARRVVKYFGDEEIDPLLDGDIELREMARELLKAAPVTKFQTPPRDRGVEICGHCGMKKTRGLPCRHCAPKPPQ